MEKIIVLFVIFLAGFVNSLNEPSSYESADIKDKKVPTELGTTSLLSCESYGLPIEICFWRKKNTEHSLEINFQTKNRGLLTTDEALVKEGLRTDLDSNLEGGQCGLIIDGVEETHLTDWECTLITKTNQVFKGSVKLCLPSRCNSTEVENQENDLKETTIGTENKSPPPSSTSSSYPSTTTEANLDYFQFEPVTGDGNESEVVVEYSNSSEDIVFTLGGQKNQNNNESESVLNTNPPQTSISSASSANNQMPVTVLVISDNVNLESEKMPIMDQESKNQNEGLNLDSGMTTNTVNNGNYYFEMKYGGESTEDKNNNEITLTDNDELVVEEEYLDEEYIRTTPPTFINKDPIPVEDFVKISSMSGTKFSNQVSNIILDTLRQQGAVLNNDTNTSTKKPIKVKNKNKTKNKNSNNKNKNKNKQNSHSSTSSSSNNNIGENEIKGSNPNKNNINNSNFNYEKGTTVPMSVPINKWPLTKIKINQTHQQQQYYPSGTTPSRPTSNTQDIHEYYNNLYLKPNFTTTANVIKNNKYKGTTLRTTTRPTRTSTRTKRPTMRPTTTTDNYPLIENTPFEILYTNKTGSPEYAPSPRPTPASGIFSKIFGGYLYRLDKEKKLSWIKAYQDCKKYGSDLASIDTQKEYNFLLAMIYLSNLDIYTTYWTSATSKFNTDFVWMSNGEKVNNEFWGLGEPNGLGKEPCVLLLYRDYYNGFKLNDVPCEKESHFFCKSRV